MMKCLFSLVVAICAGFCGAASVREVFGNPPREARVQVWYHWISDCITEEGLVRDFKAMGEADVGTAHVFAPSMANLPVKAKPMSEEWLRLFAVAIREAKKHDITLGFHNCPGWSSSGGPWVTPENSMKRVVCASADVSADGPAALKIPQPPTNADYYRDLVAYAFPLPEEVAPLSGPFPLSCADGKTSRAVSGEVTFARPVKPGFFVFSPKPGRFAASVRVEAWADGRWVKAAEQTWGMWDHTPGERVLRLSYPGQVSRFRVTCTPGALHPTMGQNTAAIEKGMFSCLPLLEEVAKCNSATSALQDLPAGNPSEKGVDPSRILDVSRFLAPDGTFDVAAARAAKALPACGADERCRIVRIGFTSTGKGPSPATIKGLECDKLDRRGIEAHWAAMPAKILALPGAKGTVKYCIIDSYEVGGQNWSGLLPNEFAKRRGYGIGKNLLCVCGYRVGTTGASRTFLHDWQRTIAELFAENYYDRFTELCHEAGVESILEPYGGPYVAMRAGRSADVPTGEFWLGGGTCGGSPRIAASLGHLNGRTRIAAESFTTDAKEGRWQLTPHELRTVGDASAWLQGINQIVVHSYLHQAFPNVKPGLSLGHHGSQINVNTTWWPEMREWTRYVRRGQALLQYGRPQADVLVLGGGYQQDLFALGMNFDLCCQEDILRLQPAADGGVAAPGQLPYRLLVVQAEASRLHPETQQALAALEKAGCRIAWGPSVAAVRKFGLRSFFEAPDALRAAYREGTDGSRIWFVVNMKGEPFYGVADFAAPAGTLPEIFDAVSGTVRAVPNVDGDAGRTKVLLDLPAKGSAFVVFSREAKRTLADVPHELISPERLPVTVEKAIFRACDDHSRLADVTPRVQALVAAGDPFAVTCHALSVRDPASMHYKELVVTYRVDGGEAQTAVFAEHKSALLKFFRPFVRQENRGKTTDLSSGWTITSFEGSCAPTAPLALPKLASWSASADPKLRHFAGRAMYEKKVEGWRLRVEGCKRTVLDLGDVRDIAKVWVDDTYVGCLWEPPYRIDITRFLDPQPSTPNPQPHTLRIEVVNTWPNRLIGDAKARAAGAAEPRGACGVPQWVLDGKADSGTGIYTWSNFGNAWKADEPLLPAGLIGPVCLSIDTVE